MPNFIYPQQTIIDRILPELAAANRADMVGLKLFPVVQKKSFMVRWAQEDNMYGQMQMRGVDGAPSRVHRTGDTIYVMEPGVYGEHVTIGEKELLIAAVPERLEEPIDVTEQVDRADRLLVHRQNVRMEANTWTLLTTGTISIPIPGPTGIVTYTDTYAIQTYSPTIPWSTTATATPIANIQTVQQLSVGHGANFGAEATLYINQVTANNLINNSNAADFGGRRDQFGATLNNVKAMSNYFQNQNLPAIEVYDEGFQLFPLSGPETNPMIQYQKYIPNGRGVLVGKRPGNAPVGEWQQTIQMMNPGGIAAPGEYHFVKNFAQGINCPVEVPPRLEVHRGFNGGCCLRYYNSVVAISGL